MDTGLAALAGTGGRRSHGTCTQRATERGSSWGRQHADEASQQLQGARQRRPQENTGPHATLKTKGFLFYEQEGTRDTSQLVGEIRVSF